MTSSSAKWLVKSA